MRRLTPDPGPVDPMQLIPDALAERLAEARPYTVANFVASADGHATVDGGSTGLGDDGDRRIFHALRGCADAVLAGTGTIGAEHYGTLVRRSDIAELRARLGLAPQPALVTVTRSGRVPAIPLLDDPAATLVVYTGAEVALDDARATVEVERRAPDGLTMSAVLADLHARHGVRRLLCEGGPAIFGALVAEAVCDELFLTLAPQLVGGFGPSITRRLALEGPRELGLEWALNEGDSMYLRYALRDPLTSA